ncbi:hypothetical protein LTS16_009975, partial [Friedmanniomyces endolithicus]
MYHPHRLQAQDISKQTPISASLERRFACDAAWRSELRFGRNHFNMSFALPAFGSRTVEKRQLHGLGWPRSPFLGAIARDRLVVSLIERRLNVRTTSSLARLRHGLRKLDMRTSTGLGRRNEREQILRLRAALDMNEVPPSSAERLVPHRASENRMTRV